MKLTNEQINALSDEQVNVMMTKCIYNAHDHDYAGKDESITLPNGVHVSGGALYKIGNGLSFLSVLDYCNDPAVMMPIVFEDGISIIKHKDYRMFTAFIAAELDDMDNDLWVMLDCRHDDAKPCRAAAIVYLKSKGVL